MSCYAMPGVGKYRAEQSDSPENNRCVAVLHMAAHGSAKARLAARRHESHCLDMS